MTDIYLDASLASLPDASDQLAHLVDAGQRLILVGASAGAAPAGHPDVARLDRLPDELARGSWFVTAEPARCAKRMASLRTLLIGPRADRSRVRGPRCDTEARDLAAAVLEILAHEAMGT